MPSKKHPSGFARLVAQLSPRWIQRAGTLLGLIFYAIDRPHRHIVERNLGFAYPEFSAARIRATSRGVFQNLGMTLLEMTRMTCWSPGDLLRNVRVEGERHLLGALADERGAIVVSAHIGNWEAALAYAACFLGLPITAIVKRMRFKPLDRWLNGMRARFGTRIRYKQRALTEMMNVMKRREALALLIDQSKRSEGVPTTFFGGRVITTSVAALLARRYRSPVVPVFCIREPDGGLIIRVEPPLKLQRSKDMRADLQHNAQLMTEMVEKVIREHPRQWFWFHKRWKKFYPHLYPEYFRRRSRRKAREKRRAHSARGRIG
jgi:KDO2-lipid IV(A) lauroyltransferase